MNYETAANKALRKFEWAKKNRPEIPADSQFRTLKVYESSGTGSRLSYVMFGLEYCDKNGENYRECIIRVRYNPIYKPAIDAELEAQSYCEALLK